MSNLAVTITFAIILTLSILSQSNARTPLIQSANLLTEYKSSTNEEYKPTTNEDDPIQLIRLPTENKPQSDVSEPETNMIDNIGVSRPLTVMYDFTLRPVNRHFHHLHIRHPFWYHRFPLPCRFHGRHVALDPREVIMGRESGLHGEVHVPLKEDGLTLDPREVVVNQKSGSDQAIRASTSKESETDQVVRTPLKEEMTVNTESGSVRAPSKEESVAQDPNEMTMKKVSESDHTVHAPLKEARVGLTPREMALRKRIWSNGVARSPLKEKNFVLDHPEVTVSKETETVPFIHSPTRENEKITLEPREATMSKESGIEQVIRDPLRKEKVALDSRDRIVSKERESNRVVRAPIKEDEVMKEVEIRNEVEGGQLNDAEMLKTTVIANEEKKGGAGLFKKVRKFLNQF